MSTTIQSEARVPSKQSVLTELRKEGLVPAVVYGYKTETTSISVKERELLKTLQITGRNGVIKLNVDGKDINVVLNDYQSDALKGEIQHADFLAINMTEELEVDVLVHLVGESIGLKEGGVLQQPNREVTIKVKPSDIPDTFDIDISKLQIGEAITVAEIRAKSKYEILNEDDHALVLISSPRSTAEMEELESVASESVEPEVIGDKKEAE
ncbi:50S ribosomal protein L25/general stress protein Ctc [Sporosarcina sp. ANT_H38]|uniref:50S ribosomal protein L25/general stress protein Ctc n=1 Tax=Sporosarcina sp. ANT_H38 TaxID=2597358 RepID=UPI0011F384AA|nr:50S ribosomal protein L25/general stress protein Ctc [Sporosarcina sp. ANT_H38]KAA0941011.1 50S ribosomal protein L25/general stress protein Ctc [Sporosarcina sp. ANT_H38]